MTKQKSLGHHHTASLKRNDYNKPPKAAKGFPNTTPGYSGSPLIHKPDEGAKK